MVNLLVGAIAMAVMLLAVDYARRHELGVKWWQWVLTILAIIYAAFTVLLIVGFLEEGAAQAALVMSLIMGLPGVIFGVLLVRFAFAIKQKTT
jgi:hypothetical protein